MTRKNYDKKAVGRNSLTRRSFLGKTATAAAAFTIIPRHVIGGKGFTPPSDLINVA